MVPTYLSKIFNDGYLGSHNDEERSEMRYAMRIAESRESSGLWTLLVPKDNIFGYVCFSVPDEFTHFAIEPLSRQSRGRM